MISAMFFFEVLFVLLSIAISQVVLSSAPNTNRIRYANTTPISLPTEEMLQYASRSRAVNLLPYKNINHRKPQVHNNFHKGRFLDEEDKTLLEKFYRETKNSDPYRSIVWNDEHQANQLKAFIDSDEEAPVQFKAMQRDKTLESVKLLLGNGWTLEPDLDYKFNPNLNVPTVLFNKPKQNNFAQAKYSPTFKLLTSYDPVAQLSDITSPGSGNFESQRLHKGTAGGNRIVGATLITHDQNKKPDVSSNSAADAIKLHNDLLKPPPNDGKVRVRMYYHRAIHDDAHLYGTGPWKYWGHGWGVEFGFDPKKTPKDNYYQKGYTIERAFGRDFCKDKKNCRQPDPKFFNDPRAVGHYTRK